MNEYKNTSAEIVKKKMPNLKDKRRVYRYFKIPKEKQADFDTWMEFYLYNAHNEGWSAGEKDAKFQIRCAIGIFE